jgi:imidazoleglycerol-phosphate dehydratase
MKERISKVDRKTTETNIAVELNLDGSGTAEIETPIPFFTHMLTNFTRHGLFDLKLRATGDVEVDLHHTVEDVGLVIGEAVKDALGDKYGITRCADASVPMMDALATVVLDISGRPYFKFNTTDESFAVTKKSISAVVKEGSIEDAFDMKLVEEFMKAFSNSAGIDLHITLKYGTDLHHSTEAIFKALGRALSKAVLRDERVKGVPSTKGSL